jgi:anti-sigma B factor antagonist
MGEPIISLGVRAVAGASILDIKGDLTNACEDALAKAYQRADRPDVQAVVLNFSKLEYMNSGGIGLLVTLLVRANRQRQRVLAYGLSDHYLQILELTRLDEAIGIYDDESAALAAIAG